MAQGQQHKTLAVQVEESERRADPISLPFVRPPAEGSPVCVALPAAEGAPPVPIAQDTVLVRQDGVLRLTAIVKASFSGTAPPLVPTQVPPRFSPKDVHHKNQPMAHVTAASDRAPPKKSIDVTVAGHACAPGGLPVREMTLRFTVPAAVPPINKWVRVVGKRAVPDAAPEPFVTMPIVYERAYGGSGTPANPIGCGEPGDDEAPNLLDADNAWRPAGFGPISGAWPLRQKRLGGVVRRSLEAALIELPAGFDVGYFQVAPPDQQLDSLPPDAVFIFEGFDPERARVAWTLPRAHPVGAAYGLSAEHPDAPTELSFRLDTVHVDTTSWTCTLTWRASVDVPEHAALGRLLVAAGVGMDGRKPSLPAQRPSPPAGVTPPRRQVEVTERLATGTLELPPTESSATLPFGKMPFRPSGAGAKSLEATTMLPVSPVQPRSALPFAPSAAPAAAANVSPPAAPIAAPAALAHVAPAAAPSAAPSTAANVSPPAAPMAAPAAPVNLATAPAPIAAPSVSPAPAAPQPSTPAKDPYGQVEPWVRGPEPSSAAAEPPRPRAPVGPKVDVRKGFAKR